MGSRNSYEQGTDEKSTIKRVTIRTESNSKCPLDRVFNLRFFSQCTKSNDSLSTNVEEKDKFDGSIIDQETSKCPYIQQLQKTRSFQKDSANFLTEFECNHLISKSKSALTNSVLCSKNNSSSCCGSSTITTSDEHKETKFLIDFKLKEFLKMDAGQAKILLFSFDLIKNDLNRVGIIAFMKYICEIL